VALSAPPERVPTLHAIKRFLTAFLGFGYMIVSLIYGALTDKKFVVFCGMIHSLAWIVAFGIMVLEYRRFLPQTWLGIRGFWCLAFIEAIGRLALFASPQFASIYDTTEESQTIAVMLSLFAVLLQLVLVFLTVTRPYDLSIELLPHTMALLQKSQRSPSHEKMTLDITPALHGTTTPTSKRKHVPKLTTYVRNVTLVDEGHGTHCEYKIEVTVTRNQNEPRCWSVKKRYREFEAFHTKLRQIFSPMTHPELAARMPHLPPNMRFTDLSNTFLETRRRGLDGFLQGLTNVPAFLGTELVLDFLDVTQQRHRGSFLITDPLMSPSLKRSTADKAGSREPLYLHSSSFDVHNMYLPDSPFVHVVSESEKTSEDDELNRTMVEGKNGKEAAYAASTTNIEKRPMGSQRVPIKVSIPSYELKKRPTRGSSGAAPSHERPISPQDKEKQIAGRDTRNREEMVHVEYLIIISAKKVIRSACKRYRDFVAYDRRLRKEIQCSLPSTLPPKMRSVIHYDYYFHEQRRLGLEEYLQSQAKDVVCSQSVAFRNFLNLDDRWFDAVSSSGPGLHQTITPVITPSAAAASNAPNKIRNILDDPTNTGASNTSTSRPMLPTDITTTTTRVRAVTEDTASGFSSDLNAAFHTAKAAASSILTATTGRRIGLRRGRTRTPPVSSTGGGAHAPPSTASRKGLINVRSLDMEPLLSERQLSVASARSEPPLHDVVLSGEGDINREVNDDDDDDDPLLISYRVAIPFWHVARDSRGEFVRYTLWVHKLERDRAIQGWQVLRRYREFAAVADALGRESRNKQLCPPIPMKKIMGGLTKAATESRKRDLQSWLRVVLNHYRPCQLPELAAFLGEGSPCAKEIILPSTPVSTYTNSSSQSSLQMSMTYSHGPDGDERKRISATAADERKGDAVTAGGFPAETTTVDKEEGNV